MNDSLSLDRAIESILFVTARPVPVKRLTELCECQPEEIHEALNVLANRLKESGSALQVLVHAHEVELVTCGDVADIVRKTVKEEEQGELSRPALEALAVLAYRGPLTRPELEQIRGVQSSMILRNLLLRGLIEMQEDGPLGQPTYQVSLPFLKQLGVEGVEGLPDYGALRGSPVVEQVLKELDAPAEPHVAPSPQS